MEQYQIEFFNAYVDALLWSSSDIDEDGEGHEGLEGFELTPEANKKSLHDCLDFMEMYKDLIDDACEKHSHYNWSQAGHDFALTRNHHGAGFWDRGIGEIGDTLTEACQSLGSVTLFVNSDEKADIL